MQVAHYAELLKEVEAGKAALASDTAELEQSRRDLTEQQQQAQAEAARLAAQAADLASKQAALEERGRAVDIAEAKAQALFSFSPQNRHSACCSSSCRHSVFLLCSFELK
jgi:peptidoglycan hydrolase CwlO-like protein